MRAEKFHFYRMPGKIGLKDAHKYQRTADVCSRIGIGSAPDGNYCSIRIAAPRIYQYADGTLLCCQGDACIYAHLSAALRRMRASLQEPPREARRERLPPDLPARVIHAHSYTIPLGPYGTGARPLHSQWSGLRLPVDGLDRAHVETQREAFTEVTKRARKRGVSKDTVRASADALLPWLGDLEGFREALGHEWRRWLAVTAEGSPLDVALQRHAKNEEGQNK